jgi:hypothetical protein
VEHEEDVEGAVGMMMMVATDNMLVAGLNHLTT